MDTRLIKLATGSLPEMNPRIVNGLATLTPAEVEEFITEAWRCSATSYPAGLEFIGGVRCTPMEQFLEITRPAKPNRTFEMTVSDVYLMKYLFRYKGQLLRPQYYFLPFISEGSLLKLMGTLYMATSVISGRVFNVENGNIYMSPLRDRLGFGQEMITVVRNNIEVHTTCVVSYLYKMDKTARSQLYPTLVHYCLAMYGLQKMLSLLFKVDTIKIGKQELDNLGSEWTVYKSRQLPATLKKGRVEKNETRIAILTSQHYPLLTGVIGTIFYIMDNAVESTANLNDLNTPLLWVQLLDRFLFKKTEVSNMRHEKIVNHLWSTQQTFDGMVKKVLLADNIHCNDIYELFAYIVINYHDIDIHNDVGSMYNKELSTAKYLLFGIVSNIFWVMYELQKIPLDNISAEKIERVFISTLRGKNIFKTKGHGEITPVSIATDCLPYYATCNVITHGKATVVGGKRSRRLSTDPDRLLHSSQAEIGTVCWVTSQDPTGRSKLNPFAKITRNNITTVNPDLQPLMENIRTLLEVKK